MELVHMGDNHYRLNGKVYKMTTIATRVALTLVENEQGKPIFQNLLYSKLEEGDLVLSPYATWKVRLISNGNDSLFENLRQYADSVDLELTGKGSYVVRDVVAIISLTTTI